MVEQIRAEMNREQESRLWFPVLEDLGYKSPTLSEAFLDQENATDLLAGGYWFATRARNSSRYKNEQFLKYAREFTIRYYRPSNTPTEWTKLFEREENVPDFMAYGWGVNNIKLDHYFILSVPILQSIYLSGDLKKAQLGPYRNIDSRQSKFYAISIDKLRNILSNSIFDKLFLHVSKGHPAFE